MILHETSRLTLRVCACVRACVRVSEGERETETERERERVFGSIHIAEMQQQQASPAADAEQGMGAPPRLQRVKRMDPPNKAALHEQIGGLQMQIESLQQRIGEIKTILDNRAQNKHLASPEQTSARNKLADLNASFKAAIERKRSHKEELDLIKEKLRSSSGSRVGLPEVRVEELDEQIRKLEYKQTHTTLPIDEEKRLISQIERLKKSRESLRRHDSRSEQDQGSRAELIELITQDDQELNRLKAAQEEQRRILADIRNKEAALALDIPALLEEKNSSYDQIKGLRDDMKQLKADFSVKEEEYWKREKEWRAQQVLERKSRAEKGRAEWLEREKLRKQRAIENFVEPYTDEIILCEQLISYMQKNAPLDEGITLPQQQQKAEIIAPEGFGVAIVSKKNRNEDDLDGWFAGSGGKRGKKAKAPTSSKSKVREKISLSIDALSSFEKVKIPPPTTYGDVPKSLEELKKKKDQFLEMQKKAREVREKAENGDSLVVDGADDGVSQASGEEALLAAESSSQVVENGSCVEHDVSSEDLSDDNILHTDALPGVEVGSSVEQDEVDLIDNSKSVNESTDSKDIVPLDDKAHMESFEFSEAAEANLDLEDVPYEEQAVENEIPADVSGCESQSGTYKEASEVEEGVVGVAENGVYSHAADCGVVDDLPVAVDVVLETIQVTQSAISETIVSMEALQVGDNTEVLERVEVLQLEESELQNETPLKELKVSQCVASPQVVKLKASPLVADSAIESSANNGLQNGSGEERLPLPESGN